MEYIPKYKKVKDGFVGQRMITLPPNVQYEITQNPLIQDFYTTALGHYPQAIYHDRKRRLGSKEYILLYCTEGNGQITLGENKYDLKPNTYIIIPPHVSHHYQSSTQNPWTIYWSHFVGSKADLLYDRYVSAPIESVRAIARSETRRKEFIKIMGILESGYEMQDLELANLSLYNLLVNMIYSKVDISTAEKTDAISKSIEYLNNNLNKTFKVEEIATQQNLSVSRFSELFKLKTGNSPIQYFNKLKIQKSCQYLYFTDLSIKEICAKIGYEDAYYYSKAFKKLMGMPPSTYRKEYKTERTKG